MGAQQRAQLVARRRRVELAQRDRVPARVPQELRRELVGVGAVEAVLDPSGVRPAMRFRSNTAISHSQCDLCRLIFQKGIVR